MAGNNNESRGEARQTFFARQQLVNAARAVFQLLSAVVRNGTIYPETHPFLLASAEKLLEKLDELFHDRKEVVFYIVKGELFFETHSVPVDQSLSLLVEQFSSSKVGGISFKPGVVQDEIVRFARVMGKEAASLTTQDGISKIMAREKISHIELQRVLLVDKKAGGAIKEGKKKAAELYAEAVENVKNLVQAVHLDKAINMRMMNTTVQTMVDDILENRDAFLGLTGIKMYDEYTFAHSVNTAVLAISLGTFLTFGKPQIAALGASGLLHDIGKTSLPIDVLNKPGKLTEEEWEVMKRHPVEGAVILSDVRGVTKLAMVTSFEHHQHGARGYPASDDASHRQHLFSQIISLADAYDAITADRVYYNSLTPPDEAIRILLKKRGTDFNPLLVKAFVYMMGVFPIGTLLKLDTGEIGLVVHQTSDLTRPHVLLLDKFDGSEKETGVEVSLVETAAGRYKRSVVGTINPHTAHINVKLYLV